MFDDLDSVAVDTIELLEVVYVVLLEFEVVPLDVADDSLLDVTELEVKVVLDSVELVEVAFVVEKTLVVVLVTVEFVVVVTTLVVLVSLAKAKSAVIDPAEFN